MSNHVYLHVSEFGFVVACGPIIWVHVPDTCSQASLAKIMLKHGSVGWDLDRNFILHHKSNDHTKKSTRSTTIGFDHPYMWYM